MPEVLFVNGVNLGCEDLSRIAVIRWPMPISRRHAMIIGAEVFETCSTVALQDNGGLMFVPTFAEGTVGVLEEYLTQHVKDFDVGQLDCTTFGVLPSEQQRRLLFEIIVKSAYARGIYRGYHDILFRPDTSTAQGLNAVELRLRQHHGRWHVFIEPTMLQLVPVVSLDQLVEEPLVYLCQNRRTCPQVDTGDDCPVIRPGHIGYYGGVMTTAEGSSFEEFDRPKLRCRREGSIAGKVVLVKPTRKATGRVAVQPFLLHRIMGRNGNRGDGIAFQRGTRTVATSAQRYGQTLRWASQLFPNDELRIGDVAVAVENSISRPEQLETGNSGPTTHGLYIPEVALRFHPWRSSGNIFDQKWGLETFGPYDQHSSTRPFKQVTADVIAPDDPTIIAEIKQVIDLLTRGYAARQGTSYKDTSFAGMKSVFKVPLRFNPDEIIRVKPTVQSYEEAARNIARSWHVSGRDPASIAIVVVPSQYPVDGEWSADEDPYVPMKTLLLNMGMPSQMVEVGKLAEVKDNKAPFGHVLWTFALDLYVKLGGKPWTLQQPIEGVNCFIGIGFGLSPRRSTKHIYAGVASVFDRNGEWLDIFPDKQLLNDEEYEQLGRRRFYEGTSSYKIAEDTAYKLAREALKLYEKASSQQPSRRARQVVIHKNGPIHECEARGFLRAIVEHVHRVPEARFALVSVIQKHGVRLYGDEDDNRRLNRVITRGGVRVLDENTAVISTSGKIYISRPTTSWYTFLGIGTPEPLMLERYVPSEEMLSVLGLNTAEMHSIEEIAEQVLALTRLHWGTMRTDVRLPVTSLYAHNVAAFVAQADPDDLDLSHMWGRLWCI